MTGGSLDINSSYIALKPFSGSALQGGSVGVSAKLAGIASYQCTATNGYNCTAWRNTGLVEGSANFEVGRKGSNDTVSGDVKVGRYNLGGVGIEGGVEGSRDGQVGRVGLYSGLTVMSNDAKGRASVGAGYYWHDNFGPKTSKRGPQGIAGRFSASQQIGNNLTVLTHLVAGTLNMANHDSAAQYKDTSWTETEYDEKKDDFGNTYYVPREVVHQQQEQTAPSIKVSDALFTQAIVGADLKIPHTGERATLLLRGIYDRETKTLTTTWDNQAPTVASYQAGGLSAKVGVSLRAF